MATSPAMISVAKDFSPFPAGRYPRDGRFNGTDFRDKHLLPLLKTADRVIVDIDNVALLPSSFWEEVWGGMVRKRRIERAEAISRFQVRASDPELKQYVDMATRFLKEARPEE